MEVLHLPVYTSSRHRATRACCESCFWSPDECTSNIYSTFSSILVSTNFWGKYLAKFTSLFLTWSAVWRVGKSCKGGFCWKQLPAASGNYTNESVDSRQNSKKNNELKDTKTLGWAKRNCSQMRILHTASKTFHVMCYVYVHYVYG